MRIQAFPWKRALALLLFLAVLAGFIVCVSRALSPYENGMGVCWRQYRAEQRDSIDVLFFGSSIQFCDVSPAAVYARSGLTAYIVGAPSQSPSVTWYYLKEALRTQSPRAVVVDLNCAGYARVTSYPAINIGMMPYSENRVAAACTAATPQDRKGLLFPLYNYRENWARLAPSQMWARLTDRRMDLSAGYCLYRGCFADGVWSRGGLDLTSDAFRENLVYFEKIAKLCSRRGIRLYFTVNPLTAVADASDIAQLQTALSGIGGEWTLLDGGTALEAIALDPVNDYFDASHMNASGAGKYSAYLADALLSALGTPTDPAVYDHTLWNARVRWFNESPEGASTAYDPTDAE